MEASAGAVLMLEKSVKDCLLWEGPYAGTGEDCKESSHPPPQGERKNRDIWWTDCSYYFQSPSATSEEEVENLGLKSSPERREEWEEGV